MEKTANSHFIFCAFPTLPISQVVPFCITPFLIPPLKKSVSPPNNRETQNHPRFFPFLLSPPYIFPAPLTSLRTVVFCFLPPLCLRRFLLNRLLLPIILSPYRSFNGKNHNFNISPPTFRPAKSAASLFLIEIYLTITKKIAILWT